MKKTAIDEGKIIKDDSGTLARAIYSAPEAMIVHIAVQPGGFVTPHVTEVDMEFFVLEGRGSFSLGDESTEAGPGILIPSPKGLPHGMRNPGPGILRVLAVKSPRPAGEE
jgi:mannose-6-phosphate isomerase-like protein (cupin superfamily)